MELEDKRASGVNPHAGASTANAHILTPGEGEGFSASQLRCHHKLNVGERPVFDFRLMPPSYRNVPMTDAQAVVANGGSCGMVIGAVVRSGVAWKRRRSLRTSSADM